MISSIGFSAGFPSDADAQITVFSENLMYSNSGSMYVFI